MVSTPEEITDDIPSFPMTQTIIKKPSDSKSLFIFTNIFDVKNNTAKRRIGFAKSKRRAMKLGTSLWTRKTKKKVIQK